MAFSVPSTPKRKSKMSKFSLIAFLGCLLVAIAQASPTGRIVGGEDATQGQFPHQISLRRNGSHHCGGSIISNNFVLTAAHCVGSEDKDGNYLVYSPKIFTVRAGSTNRLSGGVVVDVAEIKAHETYGDFLYDVALLKLATPLIYSKNIQPILLASREVPPGENVVISGWGRLKTGGDIPITLQWNTLEAISKTKCLTAIGMFSDTLLCLAHPANNGACNGDSGGPAVYKNELVGVAGFVVNGCGSTFPDGYAKVYFHREWIKKHSGV